MKHFFLVHLQGLIPSASASLQKNCIKMKKRPINAALGDDALVTEIISLSNAALVGRFVGRRLGDSSPKSWIGDHWAKSLGYSSDFFILTK